MNAAQIADRLTIPGSPDDDILIGIISLIYERLQRDRRVFNPVDNLEREGLNRIPETAWGEFTSQLTILYDAAQAAESSEDEAAAALAWESAFSFLMPLPEADELEVVEDSSGRCNAVGCGAYSATHSVWVENLGGCIPGFGCTQPESVPEDPPGTW